MARNKRISFLSELTKGYDVVLDIGTDHGFVLEKAFQKGYIKAAIASDLREKPLKQAERNLKNFPVKYVLSDGFLAIDQPFDLAVIAGMGAYLIAEIMEHAPKVNETYILQANDKVEVLRDYLMNHGFKIVDEYVVLDKFFYIVLKVTRGIMELTVEDLFLGPILKYKPEAMEYYQRKAHQIEKIMITADHERQLELEKLLKIYKNL
jgi:tRNA (adenine22-N1)-methyltransferase